MRLDSRLSDVLHVLLHMAEAEEPLTSAQLARSMRGSNPVVVRRVLAGLREGGFVTSRKGHGGGWSIARDLSTVTMLDVYEAIGAPTLFAIGKRSGDESCLVARAVNAALDEALDEAESLLMKRLGEVTLAELAADFREGMRNEGRLRHGT